MVYFNSLLAPNGKIALMGFWDRFRKKEEKEVLWTKCESCKSLLYIPELKKNLNVCPKCQHHFNMPAKDRLEYLLQDYQILFDEIRPTDPLNFKDTKGYRERLKQAQESTGLSEAMLVAEGLLKDERIVLSVMDFGFIGGSMGYRVKFVRNFTDVDDKIINKAKEECADFMTIANRYIASYYIDMENIRVRPADVEPRVTEHIKEIVEVIKALIDKGYAYESGGDVYFSVSAFPEYGKLSKRNIEELEAGARVEPSEKKRNPLDFALWKSAKAGEPAWDSPWGPGRDKKA